VPGTGILNNGMYIGCLVWNRQRFIKASGATKPIIRMDHQDVPNLRIIMQELWNEAMQGQQALTLPDRGERNVASFRETCR
jgi:hypothetical protein